MASYLVRFSIGKNNEYVYPESVARVVWKSAVYHPTDRTMIGDTDAKVKADGKSVVGLKPAQAVKLVGAFRARYPKPRQLPEELLELGVPPRQMGDGKGKAGRKTRA